MAKVTYYKTVGSIFLIIAILHLLRIINGWEAMISGVMIPMWASWAAVLIAGYLGIRGWQFAKN